jgi:multidrug efflux pump subunit AcrB
MPPAFMFLPYSSFCRVNGIYNNLPKELYPDVVVPTISLSTIYAGASPEDIETLITKPIEKQVKGLNGVKKVTSNSLIRCFYHDR